MYSSVCFKNSIWQKWLVRRFEMHEKQPPEWRARKDPVAYAIWECRPPGWYRDKCRSSFVPAVCGSSSDDVMCSCFYSRIHRGRLGLAQRYGGDLVSAMISLRSSKALNTEISNVSGCWSVISDKNLDTERHLGKKRKRDEAIPTNSSHYWVKYHGSVYNF